VRIGAALSDGTMTSPCGLRPKETERLLRLQRRLVWLKACEGDRRKDRAEKLPG
jgi:hypothetical protein